MWLTMILRNWQIVVIASLTFALGASTLYGRVLKAEKELAIANLSEYKRLADAALKTEKVTNELANQQIAEAYPRLLEQAKESAYKNYLTKFGTRNAACGVTANGLRVRPSGDSAQAHGAQGTDGVQESESLAARPEREFVDTCGRDAAVTELWKKWATLNGLQAQ